MRPQHEKLPKDLAPKKGEMYTVLHNDTPIYDAEIVKYGGGCWATVRVESPHEGYESMYKKDDTFDIRVAMYTFHRVSESTSAE